MEVGEVRQYSLWFKGDEQKHKAIGIIRDVFDRESVELRIKYSDLSFMIIEPPENVEPIEKGAKIIIGEAAIIDTGWDKIDAASLIRSIPKSDLKRLRRVTQSAWKKSFPDALPLPEKELDEYIAFQKYQHITTTH